MGKSASFGSKGGGVTGSGGAFCRCFNASGRSRYGPGGDRTEGIVRRALEIPVGDEVLRLGEGRPSQGETNEDQGRESHVFIVNTKNMAIPSMRFASA